MDTNFPKLIINLDALDATKSLDANQLIYRDLMNRLCEKIQAIAKENKDQQNTNWQHPCFFINGARGTGKSTLLRGLTKKLTENSPAVSAAPATSDARPKAKISLLAEIDPTELAEGESFFVHMLSRVWEKIDSLSYAERQDERILEACSSATKCIQSMSKGLQLLSGTRDSLKSAADASFYIEDCVEQCTSGASLKKEFRKLLDNLSIIKKVDTFLVTIDDADMNFSKCSEIMEKVRQYMICPRIIFVFAGDIKLYSLVVRGMQLKHFGSMELQYDTEREVHRLELLNKLEDQYLMKLFPIENRVMLNHSVELIHQADTTVLRSKNFSDDKEYTVAKALNDYLPYFVPKEHKHLMEALLASFPLRSVLQLLKYWTAGTPASGSNENALNEAARKKHIYHAFLMVANQALLRHNINYEKAHDGNLTDVLDTIISYIAENGGQEEYIRLIPDIAHNSQKTVAAFLSGEASLRLTKPCHQLSYICRLFPHIVKAQDAEEELKPSSTDKSQTAIHARFKQDIEARWNANGEVDIRRWMPICTAYMSSAAKSGSADKRYARGTIHLIKQGCNKGEELERNSIRHFLTGEKDNSSKGTSDTKLTKVKFFHALYHLTSIIRNNREFNYYLSIFNLLGMIISLLDRQHSDEITPEYIKGRISPLAAFPEAYLSAANTNNPISTAPEDEEDDGNAEEQRTGDSLHQSFISIIDAYGKGGSLTSSLCNEIMDWIKLYSEDTVPYFPYHMANAWSRFYAKCASLTEEAKLSSYKTTDLVQAGQLLLNYMDAFTNSLETELPQSTLHKAISDFPLWSAIREVLSSESGELMRIKNEFNRINIGKVTKTGDQNAIAPDQPAKTARRATTPARARAKKAAATPAATAPAKEV